jgi:16S rRNA (guanine(966)-N(2))-methyltransferase RsmD
VIAGKARGHNLKSMKGLATRPTLDRVREAVFNVIAPRVEEANFLDAFAGTGAIGIEALSRGARTCYFNDFRRQAVLIIKENLQHCHLEEKAKVFNLEGMQLLSILEKEEKGLCFDLIYVDPPYEAGLYETFLLCLSESSLIAPQALVIVESNASFAFPECIGKLTLQKKNRYGDTFIGYYKVELVQVSELTLLPAIHGTQY